ncbi:nucleotidyltransferase domain-containing protein [Spirosoma koreense]
MTNEQFLQEVKRSVMAIDPNAEVWLFGSRARGDAREDSDWDFLG